MARTRHSNESMLKKLRQIDVHLQNESDFVSWCIDAAISDKTCYCQYSVAGASAAFRDGSTEEGKLATEKACRIPLARQTEPEREP